MQGRASPILAGPTPISAARLTGLAVFRRLLSSGSVVSQQEPSSWRLSSSPALLPSGGGRNNRPTSGKSYPLRWPRATASRRCPARALATTVGGTRDSRRSTSLVRVCRTRLPCSGLPLRMRVNGPVPACSELSCPAPESPRTGLPVPAAPRLSSPPLGSPRTSLPMPTPPRLARQVSASQLRTSPVQASPVPASPVQASPVPASPVQASPVQAWPVHARAVPAGRRLANRESASPRAASPPPAASRRPPGPRAASPGQASRGPRSQADRLRQGRPVPRNRNQRSPGKPPRPARLAAPAARRRASGREAKREAGKRPRG